MYIKIAEHIIKVIDNSQHEENCSCGEEHTHKYDTLLAFIKGTTEIVTSPVEGTEDFTLYIEEQGYGEPFENFDVEVIDNEDGKIFKRLDYLIKITPDFKEVRLSAHNHFSLKHALMNLYSSFIVHHQWGVLLHSSCVVENHRAHIFTGNSGAGKSTAAKLSHPRGLLSDEATILKITDTEVIAYHSPFRSELWTRAERTSYPLEDIQLLRQALENKRVPLDQLQSYLKLIDKVFFWTSNPDEMTIVMQLLKKLVSVVPVYELHFEKNPSFWEVMS